MLVAVAVVEAEVELHVEQGVLSVEVWMMVEVVEVEVEAEVVVELVALLVEVVLSLHDWQLVDLSSSESGEGEHHPEGPVNLFSVVDSCT